MDWGKRNRLSRILKPESGRTVMLAVDQGYFLGPPQMLENVARTVSPLMNETDALMLTRGILRSQIPAEQNIPIVLRVSGGSSVIGADLANEVITTSLEDALRVNSSAVAISIFIGSEYESQTLESLALLVDEAQIYGMPVLVETAVGKDPGKREVRFLSLSCRIAAEFGADFVKTWYCDEFEKVVESCPVPIVITGGPRLETEMDAFRMAHDAIRKGAKGVDFGSHIWQNPHPLGMIKAVRAIVHEDARPEDALRIYESNRIS